MLPPWSVVFVLLAFLSPAVFTQTPGQGFSLSAGASTPTPPAQTQAGGGHDIPTVRVRSDEVNVVFTVVDRDGRFVRDMKQDQFRFFDNHLPPQRIFFLMTRPPPPPTLFPYTTLS